MDFNAPAISIYIRIVAIISLLLGLNDAARLLGVNLGDVSPMTTMGMTGFVLLAIFSLTRLFAAVGLWIKASWGAVLLAAATFIELLMYLLGSPDIHMNAFGFAIRLLLLVSILVIFFLGLRLSRAQAQD
jgi:hypothetical protein